MVTKNSKVKVPLLVPGFRLLRADAVWVTISNWADGLEQRYGKAEVIAGQSSYSVTEIKDKCFSSKSGGKLKSKPSLFRRSFLGKLAETFAKDLRWYLENRKPITLDEGQFKGAPFVWQHHDLFQTQGLRLAKKMGVASVLFVDAPYVWESGKWGISRLGWKWFARRWGDALPCKKADLILAVSDEVKRAVMDLGVEENKILITPCTVSTKKFELADDVEVRLSLGLKDAFVIGWIGSFRKFHSLDLLIDSFKDISSTIKNTKLMLVGDGPERLRLQEKVAHLGLQDQVVFTGNIPHSRVQDYICSFDIAVLPSYENEGFHYSPLKLREFFAAGVPVIASAVGDVKRVIQDSGGGWLVMPGKKEDIVEKVRNINSNRLMLESYSTNAKKYASEEMGIMKQILMVEDYLASSQRK